METQTIKEKETKNIRVSLIKNIIGNGRNWFANYSVVSFSKKHNTELSKEIFDTLRKATNYFNKE